MRNYDDRSKRYRGTYTDRRGSAHDLQVKITSALTLAVATAGIILVVGSTVKGVIDDKMKDRENTRPHTANPSVVIVDKSDFEDQTRDEVEKIIQEKPNLLKDVHEENYTVEVNDTIGDIAERAGNTVKRICEINGIDSSATIYPGDVFKLEVLTDKEELDKDMTCLESYFYDFVFHSSASARNRGFIYGTSDNSIVDPDSIYGKFIKLYTDYRTNLENPTLDKEQLKKDYVDDLLQLSKEVDRKINLSDEVFNITPYSRYKIYMENGTTEFNGLNDQYHSIYG